MAKERDVNMPRGDGTGPGGGRGSGRGGGLGRRQAERGGSRGFCVCGWNRDISGRMSTSVWYWDQKIFFDLP